MPNTNLYYTQPDPNLPSQWIILGHLNTAANINEGGIAEGVVVNVSLLDAVPPAITLQQRLALWLGKPIDMIATYQDMANLLADTKGNQPIHIVVADAHRLSGWEDALARGYQFYQFGINCQAPMPLRLVDLLASKSDHQFDSETQHKIHQSYAGKRILITGAAGSVGSALAKQLIKADPQTLILVDVAESPLVDLTRELMALAPHVTIIPKLQDVCHSRRLGQVFSQYKPQVVFHTAAYKHVPLLQDAIWPTVNTNIWGTYVVGKLSIRHKAERFILLSTDKAVKPTCLMGATKWIAEQWVNVLAQQSAEGNKGTQLMTMRFGNVIGSRGSVLPLWEAELASGQPITITDPTMERFFISVEDACQRMLNAGAVGRNGGLYGFWMPTYTIGQLANYMLQLNGKPAEMMRLIGVRPGERHQERLLDDDENLADDICPEVFRIVNTPADQFRIQELTDSLIEAMRFYLDDRMWHLIMGFCPTVVPPVTLGKVAI